MARALEVSVALGCQLTSRKCPSLSSSLSLNPSLTTLQRHSNCHSPSHTPSHIPRRGPSHRPSHKSSHKSRQGRLSSQSQGTRTVTPVTASLDAFVVGFEGVIASKDTGKAYPEAKEGLSATSSPFYVITRSPKGDVSNFLKTECLVDIPADSPRILEAGTTSKLDLLKQVNARPMAQDPANTMHYIDSDKATLDTLSQDPSFSRWQLYLASWSAGGTPGVGSKARPITLKDLPELLKWGLLMGVNDGCQEYEDGTPAT